MALEARLPKVDAGAVKVRPLAPGTYLVRNPGKTLPLMSVIMLAVLLIAGIVSMIDSIPLSIRTIYSYSQKYVGISPRGDPEMVPLIREVIIRESPVPVGRVMTCRASSATIHSIVGKWPFVVLGLTPDDLRYYLKSLDAEDVVGRLPNPGRPEILVSEPVARNLHLRLGSVALGPRLPDRYSPQRIIVVGIARTDSWIMLNDIDYQRMNHFPPIDNLLVYAKHVTDQPRLDRWVYRRFSGERAQVFAHYRIDIESRDMFRILYRILDVVIGSLVLVITVMMGMLMNIYQGQRLVEFGLLQAIGYTRKSLLARMLRETVCVLAGGWALGVIAAYGLLVLVKRVLMDPSAFALDPGDPLAYMYTIPVPVAVLVAATLTVYLRFRKFDPVAVIERRLV